MYGTTFVDSNGTLRTGEAFTASFTKAPPLRSQRMHESLLAGGSRRIDRSSGSVAGSSNAESCEGDRDESSQRGHRDESRANVAFLSDWSGAGELPEILAHSTSLGAARAQARRWVQPS